MYNTTKHYTMIQYTRTTICYITLLNYNNMQSCIILVQINTKHNTTTTIIYNALYQ